MKRFLGSPILSIILILLTFIFIFLNLTRGDLQFWDEGTNTGVVLESLKSSDWWNLRYSGEYFWEKPPLFYWIGIIFMKIFQNFENLYNLRIITAISSVLLILTLGLILKVRKKGLVSLNVLLMTILSIPFLWLFNPTGTLATHNFRSFDSDVLQLLFIAVSCLFIEIYSKSRGRIFLIFSAVFTGLAVMTKGIFGFIPLILLFIENYSLLKSKKVDIKKFIFDFLLFCAISFVVIVPWHLYMYANFGNEFINEYLLYHQLGRAGETLEGHAQPIYFYLGFLFDPRTGTILIPVILVFAAQLFKKIRSVADFKNFPKWLSIGALLIFVLSIIQTKISWYVLPVIPFLALYVAENFNFGSKDLKDKVVSWIIIVFLFFQMFSTAQRLVLLQKSFTPAGKDLAGTYISASNPHRVFYVFEMTGKIERIEIGGKNDLEDLNLPNRLYVDKNELAEIDEKLAGTNYRITLTEAVSDNFVVAHLVKIN